jgi:prepilin-type N-terminal cleavage/methylation domain-containing protein/prepilin-type processing-associated H-X9-DG protein
LRIYRNGFTLLELLVVIAVSALLVGILLPSLNAAREQAKSVYCLNNLRQMAIAANSYVNNNDDYYPIAYYTEKVDGIRYYHSWDFTSYKDWSESPAEEIVEPGLLWEGKTIEKIQQCPSFDGSHNWLSDPYTGYNYNTSYIGMNETVRPVNSAKVTEVGSPGKTALFGDGQYSAGANKFMRAPFSNPRDASFSGRKAGTQGFRHRGRTSVSYCDGHAESQKKLYTNGYPLDRKDIERYNSNNDLKVGFLSEDNRAYDLK